MEKIGSWFLLVLIVFNLIFLNYRTFSEQKVCVFNVREFAKTLMEKQISKEEIDKRIKEAKLYVNFLVESGKCEVVFTKDAIIAGNKMIDVTREVIAYVNKRKAR